MKLNDIIQHDNYKYRVTKITITEDGTFYTGRRYFKNYNNGLSSYDIKGPMYINDAPEQEVTQCKK